MAFRHFDAAELSRMRAVQAGAMQDTCRVLAYSAGEDEYGNPAVTYTAQDAVACGFRYLTPREIQASGEVPALEVELRLPLDTDISDTDRVRVVERYAEPASETDDDVDFGDYEVVGPVKRGPTGLLVRLRSVIRE